MAKKLIKLTEGDLHRIIKESVNEVLKEAKPRDRIVGKHTLKGLRYDKNGNPLYTSDTMSDDEKKNQGWRFSKKHGLYGQLSDPTKLTEGDLHRIIKESVNRVLTEGKTVNNKPYFSKSCGYGKAKPGEYCEYDEYDDEANPWKIKGFKDVFDAHNAAYDNNDERLTKDEYYDLIKKFKNGVELHNKRAEEKYNQRHNYEPLFGNEYEKDQIKQKQRERKRFARMLRLNHISLEDYKNSTEEEQEDFWLRLHWREQDEAREERRERAYWNNLMDMMPNR